jgi:hypothetical protein
MNKFEALKQFQAWPPEWQRLCAECWIETGEDRPAVQVWTTADKIQTAGELVQRGVSMPFDQPKAAAKMAAKVAAAREPRTRTEYTLQELDYMDSLIHLKIGPSLAVKTFLKAFPNNGHPNESLTTKFHKRRQELRKKGELA